MQSENCVSADAVKQQTSTQQGRYIRLALECMAGESLASRLRQTSQIERESAGSINTGRSNIDNCSANATETDKFAADNCEAKNCEHNDTDVDLSKFNNCATDKLKADNLDADCAELNFTRVDDIRRALYALCNRQDTDLAAQLELLVRFDDLEGWRESGAKSCAAWMNASLCIDRRTAWERLRVGRQLRLLPIIQRLFRNGRLSWSKVRLLTRVANPDNEQMLAHASLDASVSDVQRLCEDYRWPADKDESTDEGKARLQYERRRLSWRQLPDGNTHIQLVLPPEKAQNFLHSIEHCEDLLYNDALDSQGSENAAAHTTADTGAAEPIPARTDANSNTDAPVDNPIDEPISATQRRADAAVLMAERSLAYRGDHLAPADRYQVVLNVDAASLAHPAVEPSASGGPAVAFSASGQVSANSENSTAHPAVPVRKPRIEGIGPVPVATARQIACDCSLFTLLSADGEPLSVGRKSRLWPASMRRAILTRDRHCQFSGCDSHRFLQIHHIKHWADGGETSIENGVSLCQHHHQLIHSGEFTIERATVVTSETKNALTQGLFSSSKRRLLPSRCRFRVTRRQQNSHTQPINECRDGDRPSAYNYCNTPTGDTYFSNCTCTGISTGTGSVEQHLKSVHSSHTLHVATVGHGSHFLPAQAASGSAECCSKQLPP